MSTNPCPPKPSLAVTTAVGIATLLSASLAWSADLTVDNALVAENAAVCGKLTIGVTPGPVPTNGLLLHYSFDAGPVVTDESGHGFTGSVLGATYTSSNGMKSTGAYQFDGIDDRISISNASPLRLVGTSFTIATWIRPAGMNAKPTQRGILGSTAWASPGRGYYLRVAPTAPTVAFFYYTTSSVYVVDQADAAPDNVWTHVAVVHELGSTTRLYINGSLRQNAATTVPMADYTADINVGLEWREPTWPQTDRYWKGGLDDLRIYGAPLSDEQVRALYLNTKGVAGPGRLTIAGSLELATNAVVRIPPMGDLSMGSYTNRH